MPLAKDRYRNPSSVFFGSKDIEDAIRNAVSLGGDSDTMACIAGGISQAYYGQLPIDLLSEVQERIPDEFLNIVKEFVSDFSHDVS